MIQPTTPSKRIIWTSENIGYRVLANGKRSYCFRYRDSATVQRCKFLGAGSTQTQAKAKLAEVSVAKKRGDWVKVSREPFGSFAERWLTEQTELEQSTLDVYRWHLETWITPSRHFRKAISDVTHNDVAEFIADLKRYRRADRTALKGWTIRGAVSVLSGVFVEAVDQGVLASNPVEKVSRRKREKVDDETPKRILSIDEINVLLAAARERGLRWQALVGLFVFSGLRLGEALGLTWGNVDFENGELRVRKQRDAKTGLLRDVKTKASKRQVPLATPLRKTLIELQLASSYTDPSDYVITTGSGSSVSHRNALRAVTEIALACGINAEEETEEQPNLDCHSLRHVFGSAMIKATNGDAERVRVWMGHSDTKTLLRCYSHEFEAVRGGRQIAQEIAQIDAAFAG